MVWALYVRLYKTHKYLWVLYHFDIYPSYDEIWPNFKKKKIFNFFFKKTFQNYMENIWQDYHITTSRHIKWYIRYMNWYILNILQHHMKMIFFKQNSQKYGPLFETMLSPFVNDCTKIPTNEETLQNGDRLQVPIFLYISKRNRSSKQTP